VTIEAPAPWVNVDRYEGPGVNPDVVADAGCLPFEDGSAEAVYAGHLLEHLDIETELPAVLAEVRRVLGRGGLACIVGPDIERAQAGVERGEDWAMLLPSIRDGGCRWEGDRHKWISTGPRTLELVRPVFPHAAEVDITCLGPYWPVVDKVGWQFACLAPA
jgi:SAM-dependent methyltransferase